MKTLRKNIDLDSETIAVLQIESTLNGRGSLKPFLESLLKEYAQKCMKNSPNVYRDIVKKRVKKMRVKETKLIRSRKN